HRSSLRPFTDHQIDRADLTAATDGQGDPLANAGRAKRAQHPADACDGVAVPGLNDVALVDAGLGAWAVGIHAHHHRAEAAVTFDPDRPRAEAEIAARDLAVGLELSGDPRYRGAWDDEDAPARAKHGHAEGAAGGIEREPTFGRAAQRQVKLEARINLAA